MHLIDAAGHANNQFVHEDPATNRPPTEVDADWLNAVQNELANAIKGFGISLDKTKSSQLLAVLNLFDDRVSKLEERHKSMGDGNAFVDVTGLRIVGTTYVNTSKRMKRVRITAVATVVDGYVGISTNGASVHRYIPVVGWTSAIERDIWPGDVYSYGIASATLTKIEETQ